MNHRRSPARARRPGVVLAAAALVAPLAGAGCVLTSSPQLAAMKTEIETAVDGDFEREMGVRLGRLSIGLGRAVVGMVARHDDEADLARVHALLRGLRKVEVGVYDAGELGGDLGAAPERIERAMARDRWMPAVRVRSEDELAWVFCRLDGAERLRGVTVVSLDEEQLLLVRLSGRLDRALAAGMSLVRDSGENHEHAIPRDLAAELDAGELALDDALSAPAGSL
jgi:hypothetical protein